MNYTHYLLIPPPTHLPVADLSEWTPRNLVDYEQHPAYASLISSAGLNLKLKALRRFLPSYFVIKLKRAIRYEMIPLHIRKFKGLGGVWRLFHIVLQHLFQPENPHAKALRTPLLVPLDETFRENGCAVLRMPDSTFTTIERLSAPNFIDLQERRYSSKNGVRNFEASRSYARRDEAIALFSTIEQMFSESGIMEIVEVYLGRNVRLIDVNPQINDSSDDFWRRIFPDLNVSPPSTAYLHRDASGGDIKIIIYMSEVSSDNGPFSYVLGSHQMPLNRTDDHVSEANDSNGMAGTDVENRRCFAALPAVWRQKGAFGNDVLNDTPVSNLIQNSLWQIIGGKGSIVMFDTKGVHRGGMVVSGERRVITCVIG